MTTQQLNRLLLAATVGVWLTFLLLQLTSIADAVIASLGIIVSFLVILFPSVKNFHNQSWFYHPILTAILSGFFVVGISINLSRITSNPERSQIALLESVISEQQTTITIQSETQNALETVTTRRDTTNTSTITEPQDTTVAIQQPQIITVTQIRQTSDDIIYVDDFENNLNGDMGLEETETVSLTASIRGGDYVMEIDSDKYVQFTNLVTGTTIRNFDLSLQFSDIQSEDFIYFNIVFRSVADKVSTTFSIFLTGDQSGLYYISSNPDFTNTDGKLSLGKLNLLRIRCVKSTCSFYVNNREEPFRTIDGLLDVAGNIKFGLSGHGSLRIDSVSILNLGN